MPIVIGKKEVRIYFGAHYRINLEFEKALDDFLRPYGFKRWTSGLDLSGTGVRDIAYEMDSTAGSVFIQVRSPVTGKYVKIDRRSGSIVAHKRTAGPYKGIPMKESHECG